MKNIIEYILEARSQSNDIKLLTEYIYNKISELIYTPVENSKFKTGLAELIDEYDGEYELEINFSDISGFKNTHSLRTWHTQNEINAILDDGEEHDCDIVVLISDDIPGYGSMETDKPTLNIGTRFVKTPKLFEKESSALRNTIAHELIHYIQFLGDNDGEENNRIHNVKHHNTSVSKELREKTEGNMRYYSVNFIMYAWDPIERDARRSGFYETINTDIDKHLKEWNKKHKKEPFNKEEFADYVIHHESYDANVLHIGVFDKFVEGLEKDTWKDFAECIANPEEKYKDNSLLYVVLNIADNRESTPPFPLPSHKNYVLNITSEKRYNEYKAKLLKYFNKDYKKYKKKLVNVIYDILNTKNIK